MIQSPNIIHVLSKECELSLSVLKSMTVHELSSYEESGSGCTVSTDNTRKRAWALKALVILLLPPSIRREFRPGQKKRQ
jgi:hypothetical protein